MRIVLGAGKNDNKKRNKQINKLTFPFCRAYIIFFSDFGLVVFSWSLTLAESWETQTSTWLSMRLPENLTNFRYQFLFQFRFPDKTQYTLSLSVFLEIRSPRQKQLGEKMSEISYISSTKIESKLTSPLSPSIKYPRQGFHLRPDVTIGCLLRHVRYFDAINLQLCSFTLCWHPVF